MREHENQLRREHRAADSKRAEVQALTTQQGQVRVV